MKKLLILCFILPTVLLSAFQVSHNVPLNEPPNKDVVLEIAFSEGIDAENVKLYYRYLNRPSYNVVEEELNGWIPSIKIDLPIQLKPKQPIEYYFEVTTASQTITSPAISPRDNPHVMYPMKLRMNEITKDIFFLSPQDNKIDENDVVVFSVSYFNLKDKINKEEVYFYVNEKRVKPTVITNTIATFKMRRKPKSNFEVYCSIGLKNGSILRSNAIEMEVLKPKIIDFSDYLSGSLTVNSSYDKDGGDVDSTDKKVSASLRLQGSADFLQYRTNIFMSSRESSKKQMINRYLLELEVPHFTAIFGDHAPRYGGFIFNNTNVRGFHSAVEFKYWRMYFSAGLNNRAINETATFDRKIYGFRTEFGSQRGFEVGMTLAKAKDDKNSIDESSFITLEVDENGNIDKSFIATPKDNIVGGTDLTLRLFNNRFVLGADIAASLYNSNTYSGAITTEDLEDMDVDIPLNPEDYESLFVLNTSVEPFYPSLANVATQVYSQIMVGRQFFKFGVSQVGTSYTALSNGYTAQDNRSIFAMTQLNLMQNRFMLGLNARISTDNLQSQKNSTNNATSYSANAFYRFNQNASLQAFASSFTIEDDKDLEKLIDQQTISYQVGYSQKINNIPMMQSTLTLQFMTQTSADDGFSINNQAEYQLRGLENEQQNISLSMKTKFDIYPAALTYFSYSRTNSSNDEIGIDSQKVNSETSSNAITIGSDFFYLENRLKPYFRFKTNLYDADNAPSNNTFDIGTKWKVRKNTTMKTNIQYTKFSSDVTDESTLSANLRISQRF